MEYLKDLIEDGKPFIATTLRGTRVLIVPKNIESVYEFEEDVFDE